MTAEWYYSVDGRILGPVASDTLRQRAESGEINATDLVWREGMPDWIPASAIGLTMLIAPPPVAAATTSSEDAVPDVSSAQQGALNRGSAPPPITSRDQDATRQRKSQGSLGDPHRPAGQAPGLTRWLRIGGLIAGAVVMLMCGVWLGRMLTTNPNHLEDDRVVAWKNRSTPQEHSPSHGEDSPPDLARGKVLPAPSGEIHAVPAAGEPGRTNQDHGPPATGTAPGSTPPPGTTAAPDATRGSDEAAATAASDAPSGEVPATTRPTETAASETPATKSSPKDTTVSPAEPGPSDADGGPRVFYQTLDIHRRPTFVVLGTTLAQELRYRIVSQIEIGTPDDMGARRAVQIIERTRLLQADDLTRAAYATALKSLERQQYTFKLNARNEIIEFTRPGMKAAAVAVERRATQGVQLTKVIDDDGWKELAELTFFRPEPDVAQGQPYVRQISHDWTPLGAWSGTTRFTGQQVVGDQQTINFRHSLTYVPPKANPAAGPLGLRIVSAACSIDRAEGDIEYDLGLQRVANVRETFQVHGTIAAELLGQPATIELQERQLLTIRITAQPPTDE